MQWLDCPRPTRSPVRGLGNSAAGTDPWLRTQEAIDGKEARAGLRQPDEQTCHLARVPGPCVKRHDTNVGPGSFPGCGRTSCIHSPCTFPANDGRGRPMRAAELSRGNFRRRKAVARHGLVWVTLHHGGHWEHGGQKSCSVSSVPSVVATRALTPPAWDSLPAQSCSCSWQ